MRYKASLPTAVLGLFVLAACDSSELVSPDPAVVDPVGPKVQVKTSDDEFARASRAEAPGFAGFYLDEDGTPVIRLVDTGKGAAARQYLALYEQVDALVIPATAVVHATDDAP